MDFGPFGGFDNFFVCGAGFSVGYVFFYASGKEEYILLDYAYLGAQVLKFNFFDIDSVQQN